MTIFDEHRGGRWGMGEEEETRMARPKRPPKPPKRTSPDLLDYTQAADRLNVSEATVRRLIDRGLLKSVPVSPSGRRRMIRVVDLDEYLDVNATLSPTPADAHPQRSTTVSAAMKQAGWDGSDHLGYVRKPRK
jgi:excisionase family DNA binding protein